MGRSNRLQSKKRLLYCFFLYFSPVKWKINEDKTSIESLILGTKDER